MNLKNNFKDFFLSLYEFIFPTTCSGCRMILEEEEKTICFACRLALPFTGENPIKEDVEKKINLSVEHVFGLLYFQKTNLTQKLIHRLKYKNDQKVGAFLGELLAQKIKNLDSIIDFELILPMPLHKKRLKERGYNQVSSFGKALSKNLNIPFREDILRRKIYKKSQTFKNKEKRLEEIKNIFECEAEIKKFSHILLIDDVLTTGATMESCAKTILRQKNLKISVALIAYAI